MNLSISRRAWLGAPLSLPYLSVLNASPQIEAGLAASFPSHPPELARETVGAAHANIKRLTELVEARPALANAAWDWGFGDWETALGAASHMGNREIAELLLSRGAHPTIFSATMMGELDVVKAFVAARPGIQRTLGPHGIPLLSHAKAGGARAQAVLGYLESLGDAGGPTPAAISEEELARLAGDYAFGSGSSDRIEITLRGRQLSFTRKGMTPRPIHHTGGRVFRPAGAGAARIRFVGAGADLVLTVHDPDVVLTARRVQN